MQTPTKVFPIYYGQWGGNFLKHISTIIYYTKYNKINICQSAVQKYLSYTGSQKISDILWAMIENGWKCIFNYVSRFVSIIQYFHELCGA